MLSLYFLVFSLLSAQVLAFHFSFNPPSECDDLGLTWTGGSPPFSLYMVPVFGTPRNISIPNSAFSNGKGSYSLQLPLKKDQQVVFTMSDSTGFNTGGSSNVYTVRQSKGGVCNATNPPTDFIFQLNSDLQQCRPFTFSGYDDAVPPVTIGVIIPGGNALTMSPPNGQSSYSWTVNAARGTSMIFFMTDSQGHQGGSSDIRYVGASEDSSCLDGSSLSTTNAPSPTSSTTSGAPSSTAAPTSTSVPISAASIAGAIIGSVLFLAVAITLALFLLKRMPSKKSKAQLSTRVDLTDGDAGRQMYPHDVSPYGYPSPLPPKNQIDLGSYGSKPSPLDYGGSKYPVSETSFPDLTPHFPPPPVLYPPQPRHSYSPQSQRWPVNLPASPVLEEDESELPYAGVVPSSPRHSTQDSSAPKTGVPSHLSARYILHTDAEDVAANEGGFVELPPQYSERQGAGKFNTPLADTKHSL